MLKVIAEVTVNHSTQKHYLATVRQTEIILNEQLNPVAKQCYKCRQLQTLNSFYTDKSGMLGKTTSCADCRREHSKQYRQDHPDYYRNYQVRNREHLLEYRRGWTRVNQRRIQQYTARAVKQRAEALDNCLPDDTEYIARINSNPVCSITGVTVHLELDHVMPVTCGHWGNTAGNLMYLHKPLNTSKNNSNVFSWLAGMTQDRLDYLLPDGIQMTVEQFTEKFEQELTVKAAELGLTFTEYKQKYQKDFQL